MSEQRTDPTAPPDGKKPPAPPAPDRQAGIDALERLELSSGGPPPPDHVVDEDGGGGRGWLLGLLALLLLGAGGAALWWFVLRPEPPPPEPEAELPPPIEEVAPPPIDVAELEDATERELPPVEESDPLVQEMAAGMAGHPDWPRWLAGAELLQRFTATVDRVAAGRSPAPQLAFLRRDEPFAVQGDGESLRIDPATYRRWDQPVAVFTSINPINAGRVFRGLEPLVDGAYRQLGYPERRFRDTLSTAVDHLLATPEAPPEPLLKPAGAAGYAYADPDLEALSPAQKQLLRLGPENAGRVKAQLRALAAAVAAERGAPPAPDEG